MFFTCAFLCRCATFNSLCKQKTLKSCLHDLYLYLILASGALRPFKRPLGIFCVCLTFSRSWSSLARAAKAKPAPFLRKQSRPAALQLFQKRWSNEVFSLYYYNFIVSKAEGDMPRASRYRRSRKV